MQFILKQLPNGHLPPAFTTRKQRIIPTRRLIANSFLKNFFAGPDAIAIKIRRKIFITAENPKSSRIVSILTLSTMNLL
jgi:hypothetical protein